MFALKAGLEQYVSEHDGQMPATFDDLRAHMKEKKGGTYDTCVRARAPFIWMPEGVKTDDGHAVVIMCPADSHGWLRKYAFGLAQDGRAFVRVRNGRATRLQP